MSLRELVREMRNEPTLGTFPGFTAEVTVGSSAWATVGILRQLAAGGNLGLLVENTGGVALAHAQLLWRPTPDAAWQVLVADGAWASAPSLNGTYAPDATPAGVTRTDLVIVSASTVTSATEAFTATHLGRQIKVTAGTGFTTGWYKIVDVDTSGVATVAPVADGRVSSQTSVGAVGSAGGTFIVPGVSCVELSAVGYEFMLQAKTASSTTTVRSQAGMSLAHLDINPSGASAIAALAAAMKVTPISCTGVTITTDAIIGAAVALGGRGGAITVEISNPGAVALATLYVKIRAANGTTAVAFPDATSLLGWSSADYRTLAGGAKATWTFNVPPSDSVEFWCSSSGAAVNPTVTGTFHPAMSGGNN